jgi:hypothetical protein
MKLKRDFKITKNVKLNQHQLILWHHLRNKDHLESYKKHLSQYLS